MVVMVVVVAVAVVPMKKWLLMSVSQQCHQRIAREGNERRVRRQ